MEIKVLGACCAKSEKSLINTKTAVEELGLDIDVENVGDYSEIMKYNVMSTPALVIDGKVVLSGKLIKVKDAKKFITQV